MILQILKKKQLYIVVILVLFSFYKIHIGLHSDEAHFIAVGDMISRDNCMFKEIWYYLQMSGVFIAPIIRLYETITGGKEGIILLFRILSIIVQLIICGYFYDTFQKRFDKKYTFLAALLLYMYIPDMQSFNYKQAIIWMITLMIIYSYRYYETNRIKYIVLLGLAMSVCVLEYPTSIIFFLLYIVIIICISQKENRVKAVFALVLTCICCATVFFVFVFSKINIAEFIYFFPKVFKDDNLDKHFFTKLIHPFVKYGIMCLAYVIVLTTLLKIKIIKNTVVRHKLPIISILLFGTFCVQCFIERSCITWHCITYPYMMTLFMLISVVHLPYYKNEYNFNNKKELLTEIRLFVWPVLAGILAMALASNQGNITSMYPTILAATGLVLILSEFENRKKEIFIGEKRILCVTLFICALCMYVFPVWEQEACWGEEYGQRNVFSERMRVGDGCLAGIYIGSDYYFKYYTLYDITEDMIGDDDITLIIDDYDVSALGYMNIKGLQSTFSPQGGLNFEKNDKIVEYFNDNPRLLPTKILMNMDYIGMGIEDYLDSTPLGEYITAKGYLTVYEKDNYILLSR